MKHGAEWEAFRTLSYALVLFYIASLLILSIYHLSEPDFAQSAPLDSIRSAG